MTPQEKAKDLINKYYVELKEHKGYYDLETAIQCALIAVDEMIKQFEQLELFVIALHWSQVKQELTKQQEQ